MGKPGSIQYTVQIWREGHQFVAHAMPIDVMSSGRGVDEARAALDEAVRLFLDTAADTGALETILQDAGYVYEQGHWTSPEWVAVEQHAALVAA